MADPAAEPVTEVRPSAETRPSADGLDFAPIEAADAAAFAEAPVAAPDVPEARPDIGSIDPYEMISAQVIDPEADKNMRVALLCEKAERYDQMLGAMKEHQRQVTEIQMRELTAAERTMWAVAYKYAIMARRGAWRTIVSIEQKGESERLNLIQSYRQKIERELVEIIDAVLQLLGETLIPAASDEEAKVFFHKMKADYHRYLAEIQTGEARKASATLSLETYEACALIANADLTATHPLRLSLALNFSIFYYEVLNQPSSACHLAKQAFDAAISGFELMEEADQEEATLLMQLLRDNLTLWVADNGDDPEVVAAREAEKMKIREARAAEGAEGNKKKGSDSDSEEDDD